MRYLHLYRHHIKRQLEKRMEKTQMYKYLLILDFEATCQDGKQIKPQEIIEFPVLKLNTSTLAIDSVFHQYVEPKVHSKLTPFCTQLTGIQQEMVDGQPHLEDVLQALDKWMAKEDLLSEENSNIFVTCGDWDLRKMLPSQCEYFNLTVPGYLKRWINIKKAFAENTGHHPRGMMEMLMRLNIEHVGRHHSGIDDCKNIAAIATELIKKGYVFHQTSGS